jgi:ubiquinone/menaquinone biosynthesis C-methylase UbiE
MTKTRIEYPGTIIHEGDPENHFRFQDTGLREYYNDVIRRIPGLMGFEGKALHIGCGTAAFENLLCDKLEFARFYGLEMSPTLLRIGEAISSRFGYADRINLKTWSDDLLPYPDNEFELVFSLISMHQWKNPEKTLPEIMRVIKRGGSVFISDIRRDQFYLPFYFFAQKMGSSFGKEIAKNLANGYKASYTVSQIREILESQGMNHWNIEKNGKWFDITWISSDSNNPDSSEVSSGEDGGKRENL